MAEVELDEYGQPIEEVFMARRYTPNTYVLNPAVMKATVLAIYAAKEPVKRSAFEQLVLDGARFSMLPKLRRGPRPESWPAHWPVIHRDVAGVEEKGR